MSELQPVGNYLEYGDVLDNIIITTDDDGDSDGDDGDEDHLFAAPSIRCGLHHLEDRVGGETEPETHTELQRVRLCLNACLDAKF